jgi:hypothetical protein
MKTLTKMLLPSILLFSAFLNAATAKPDFSGSWVLNVQKSDLGGAPITKISVQIDHKDPIFKYFAKGAAGGQDFEETESFSTDGAVTRDSRGATVKAHWDGATLIIESFDADSRPIDETHLTLSADSKFTTRDYVRKSPDDPQTRHEVYEKH